MGDIFTKYEKYIKGREIDKEPIMPPRCPICHELYSYSHKYNNAQRTCTNTTKENQVNKYFLAFSFRDNPNKIYIYDNNREGYTDPKDAQRAARFIAGEQKEKIVRVLTLIETYSLEPVPVPREEVVVTIHK